MTFKTFLLGSAAAMFACAAIQPALSAPAKEVVLEPSFNSLAYLGDGGTLLDRKLEVDKIALEAEKSWWPKIGPSVALAPGGSGGEVDPGDNGYIDPGGVGGIIAEAWSGLSDPPTAGTKPGAGRDIVRS